MFILNFLSPFGFLIQTVFVIIKEKHRTIFILIILHNLSPEGAGSSV